MIKDIIKDSFLYLASKSVVAVVNIVLIYYILDVYGAVEYSKYTIYFILSLSISNLTSTWFSQSYLRMRDQISGSYLSTFLIYILIFIFLFSLLVFLIYKDMAVGLLFFTILTISQSVYLLGRTFLQKQRLIKSFFYFDLLRILLILLGCWFLSKNGIDYKNILLSYTIGNFAFIVVFVLNIEASKPNFTKAAFLKLKSCFSFGFPVAIWLTIASSQMLIDRYLLSSIFGHEITGFYASYYDFILKTCALFVIPVSNAIYPILVENEKDFKSYKPLALKLSIFSIFISAFISLILFLTMDFIAIKLTTELKFDSALIATMVFGIVLWQMALIFQKPLEMQNNTKKMVVNIVLCVATSTLLNISLADLFGVSIFAFSLSISAILYLALTYISVKQ